jgi:hypothetical protein
VGLAAVWGFRHHLDLADLDASLFELSACGANVSDDQLQALERARLHVRDDSLTHDYRTAGPGRRERDDPIPFADLRVVVHVEAELLLVERLGAIDIRYGHHHHFERPIHEPSP